MKSTEFNKRESNLYQGFEAISVEIYSGNTLLPYAVSDLVYIYSEDMTDAIRIELSEDNVDMLDDARLQHHQALFIVWGYVGGKKSKKRKVYIVDSTDDVNEQGVKLTLFCYPRAYYLRFIGEEDPVSDSTPKEYGDKITEPLKVTLQVDETADVEIEPESFEGGSETGSGSTNTNLGQPESWRQSQFWKWVGNTLGVSAQANAKKSQWQIFKELVGKTEQDTPVDVVLRDDKLIVKNRDYSKPTTFSWTWKAEGGEVLSFNYSSNNREQLQQATGSKTQTWDEVGQEFIEATSNQIPEETSNQNTQPGDVPTHYIIPKSSVATPEDWQIMNAWVKQGGSLISMDKDGNVTSLSWDYSGNDEESVEVVETVVEYIPTIEELEDVNQYRKVEFSGSSSEEIQVNVAYIPIVRSNYGATPDVSNPDNGARQFERDNTRVSTPNQRLNIAVNFSSTQIVTNPTPEDEAESAATRATTDSNRAAADSNNATLKLLGNPLVESGITINIFGVGNKNSGSWYVIRAEHNPSPSSGYITTLTLNRTKALDNEEDTETSGSNLGTVPATNVPQAEGSGKTTTCRKLTTTEKDAIAYIDRLSKAYPDGMVDNLGEVLNIIIASSNLIDVNGWYELVNTPFENWFNTFLDEVGNQETITRVDRIYAIEDKVKRQIICKVEPQVYSTLPKLLTWIKTEYMPALRELSRIRMAKARKENN